MSSFKSIDSKREEFRKYLEKAGVVDVLTKVLVSLYEEPEKPDDALEYLKRSMSIKSSENVEVEALRLELEELKTKVEALIEENNLLKNKITALDPENAPSKDALNSNKEVC